MRKASWAVFLATGACLHASMTVGQETQEKPVNPVHLELTMEVAATTDEGYPSVLRVTVRNVGNVAVDLPMPALGCLPRGGHVAIHLDWHPSDPSSDNGRGWGMGCGSSDIPNLMIRVRSEWIRLHPGEFIVSSENLRERLGKVAPGTIEYWAEYLPPEANENELAELQQAGYVVPIEKVETAHQSFVVH